MLFRALFLFAFPWLLGSGCAAPTPSAGLSEPAERRLFIIGQDLDAIRGYTQSNCCPAADGTTAYVSLYNVLSEELTWGGLGLSKDGKPTTVEADWGGGPSNAYTTATEFDVDYLAIGLSLVESWHPGALNRVLVGGYDAEIDRLALFAEEVDRKILLRIGYEFDGYWNDGYGDAQRYTEVWRYIVDRLRSQGADRIEYVWQGAASTTDMVLDGGRHDNIRDWYPGDDYVDWLGISWFMHPEETTTLPYDFDVLTPRQLSDEVLALAREVGKPVLIAEAAPQGYDLRELTSAHHVGLWDGPAGTGRQVVTAEHIWANWFEPMFDYMNDNRDVIRGLAYINIRWDDQDLWDAPYESGYWGDTRVEANPDIARRFTAAINTWRNIDE
ncbi:MAG: glycosyl hydrolase [Pseudomonadota bacterium]